MNYCICSLHSYGLSYDAVSVTDMHIHYHYHRGMTPHADIISPVGFKQLNFFLKRLETNIFLVSWQ